MSNTNFNKLIYKDKITSVYDVVSNKNSKVHKTLYNAAVNNYIKYFCEIHSISKEEFNNTFTILEVQNNSIDSPNSIIQRNKTANKKFEMQYKVDLTPFWPEYKFKNSANNVINIDPTEDFGKKEIVYVDYVRGEATVFNNYLDEYNQIPLNNVNINSEISDEMNIK